MKRIVSIILSRGEKSCVWFLQYIVHFVFNLLSTLLWIPVAMTIPFKESYYPEYSRKKLVSRMIDNLYWVIRYQRANIFYNMYGLDIKGSDASNYLDEKGFWKGLKVLNYCESNSTQVPILRDKYLFYKYMKSIDMPVPEVFAVLKEGVLYSSKMELMDPSDLKLKKHYFVKDVDGECASFVKKIQNIDEATYIIKAKQSGMYIFQDAITQSIEMSRINPYAVNTLRVITIYNNGQPYVLSALLRVGTNKSKNVDNWAAGGLAIGIAQTGYLNQYGFYKNGYGTKTDKHPDTGIKFNEFKIPYLEEAYQLACRAHKSFYGLGAIGWDIAITEAGPVFIEGNDNFEITLMQAADRPLKQEWNCIWS